MIDRLEHIVRVPGRLTRVALVGFAFAAGAALAACGGGAQSDVQVSSVGCSSQSGAGGGAAVSRCVFVLSDGRRFSCPEAFAHTTQTAAGLEHAKSCTRLTPIAIPAAARPVFAAVERARSCLVGQALRVVGGPVVGLGASTPDTPLGELIVGRNAAPAFIAFYRNSQAARQAEPVLIQNARRLGGAVTRRGAVTVLWTRPPSSAQRAAVEGCAFAQ